MILTENSTFYGLRPWLTPVRGLGTGAVRCISNWFTSLFSKEKRPFTATYRTVLIITCAHTCAWGFQPYTAPLPKNPLPKIRLLGQPSLSPNRKNRPKIDNFNHLSPKIFPAHVGIVSDIIHDFSAHVHKNLYFRTAVDHNANHHPSDSESSSDDEHNMEGSVSVYECPGLATVRLFLN